MLHRFTRLATSVGLVALLAACAHPIQLETSQLPPAAGDKAMARKVAYVISDADRSRQVSSAGGGADRVTYHPYRDLEPGIRAALASVYADVTALQSEAELPAARQAGITLIFVPVIATESSSSSVFTWPPTRFSSEVALKVKDAQGQPVTEVRVRGEGAATHDEFSNDVSLAARRASADMAAKLSREIRASDKLR